MTTLTPEHREWLDANRVPRIDRDRWLYSPNARPIIDELCDMGIMQAASGEFGTAVDKGETATLLGKSLPVFEMTSFYMLTPYGRTVLADALQGDDGPNEAA